MIKIITNIPLFVWPLFIILLIIGLRARKTNLVPLAILLIIPSVLFVFSFNWFFKNYGHETWSILLWIIFLAIGFLIGLLHMQKLKLRFDKQKRKVEMQGSWIPLMLAISLFTFRFTIGIIGSLFPHLEGSAVSLSLELVATTVLGISSGRGVGCLVRYQSASDMI